MLILGIAYLGLALLITPFSVWFLFHAQTAVGISFALLGICSSALPGVWGLWKRDNKRSPIWKGVGLGLVVILLGGLIIICTKIPSGRSATSSVSHQFTTPVKFNPYTLPNVVPEVEQVNLGFLIMPYFDTLFTREQSQRVTSFTLELYEEMERDPDFRALGSAMGWTYAELIGQPFDVGHYYLYIPQPQITEPMPVLLFLHGSAGNFKVYTWYWSRLADELGFVIVAPSFGFGNWGHAGGVEAALAALDDVEKRVNVDRTEVYLAGLSNGGIGASRVAAHSPERFKGLILLSPVLDEEHITSSAFIDAWRGRPVLFITGEADRRVPVEYVSRRATILQSGGVTVDFVRYPQEDHFLLFSQADPVREDISHWLAQVSEKMQLP